MRGHLGRVLAVLAFLVAGCTSSAETEPPGSSALRNRCEPLDSMPTDEIAFTLFDEDGAAGIYLMDPDGSDGLDGSGATCLVDMEGEDVAPAWSRDGAMIAFASDVDGDFDVYIVRADGSDLTRITNEPGDESSPSWSPDGRTIVFSGSGGGDGPFAIRTVRIDGGGMTSLVETGDRWEWACCPIWSPDGSTIAFGATEGGYGGAYAMDTDGSHVRLLIDGEGDDSVTEWSPDGTKIAMVADRDGGCIFLMSADGSHLTRLTKGCAEGFDVTWSPDGDQVAWGGGSHGPADAYVIDTDGSDLSLLNDEAETAYLAWQPS